MIYIKEEKELSVKDIFFDICAKWRSVIGICFLGVFVVALVNVPSFLQYKEVLGLSGVCKVLIKHLVVVGIVIAFCVIVFYAIKYLVSDTIKSVEEYSLYSNVKILGVIPQKNNKKHFFIDKIIKKYRGIKLFSTNRDCLIKRVANVINTEIGLKDLKNIVSIAVVSSCSASESDEFVKLVESKVLSDNIKLLSAGDIMVSADAINIIYKADCVILVERQGKSKYSEMKKTCEMLDSWNKEIMGAILLDVDAI